MNLHSPFSPEQVQRINEFQTRTGVGLFAQPITCKNRDDGAHGYEGGDLGVLVATEAGMICPHCEYTLDQVPTAMADRKAEFVALIGPDGISSNSVGCAEIEAILAAYRKLSSRGAKGADVMAECLSKRLEAVRHAHAKPAEPLVLWTVYERPVDFPTGFIARKWEVHGASGVASPTTHTLTDATLDGLRAKLPQGLHSMPREALDETQIVETWL